MNPNLVFPVLACTSAFLFSTTALAEYPDRPISFVVPYLAGAAPDTVARTVGRELSEKLGQPVVVENKTGAGGGIAAEFVARSQPDGYTLLATNDTPLVLNPFVYAKQGYDALTSFEPISMVARSGFYMVACPTLPVNNVRDLVELAKTKKMSYASSGYGSPHHLMGELLRKTGGVELTHVPYKGVAAALLDVMNCSVDIGFAAVGTILPQVVAASLKVKVLAISSPTRESRTPAIPTMGESGYPALQFEGYYALLAPKGTSKEVVNKLSKATAGVLADPTMQKRITEMGLTLSSDNSAEYLRREIEKDYHRYSRISKEIGLTAK